MMRKQWEGLRRALEQRFGLPRYLWKVSLALMSGVIDRATLADQLCLSPGSVDEYFKRLYGCLKVHSKAEALWKLRQLAVEERPIHPRHELAPTLFDSLDS